jgi:predicted ATPase
VATGAVVVGEGRGEGEDSRLAVGETPNVAARLQSLAGEDEIVVGATTRRLAGGVFGYEDLGRHVLKGIVEPVAAWKVTGIRETEGRFEASRGAEQRLSGFVGREAEVGLLGQKWAQACAGEGQVVLLEGEPGIGKSRITQWLLEHIVGAKHYRLRYQCSPYHAQSAFHPLIEQIERAAKFGAEDGPEARLDKLQALLDNPRPSDARTQALFAALLGLSGWEQRHGALNLTPQKQKELTLQALSAHVLGLSEDAPVLLLLEDAHWIDPSTLESLNQTVEAIRGHRVLVLITYRPEFQPAWVGQGHVAHLTLNRLSPGQTRALAEHVTAGKTLPEEIVAQIVQRTDGIPLFVEELTKAVLEAGLLELDTGTNSFRLKGPLSPIAIPATLRDSLTARLDRLSPTKEVAQIGACIGREFGYGLLEKVAGLSPAQLSEALERLTGSELVYQKGEPPEASYSFKHALIQDAAYDGLLKSRRAQIHARIAQVLEEDFAEIARAQPEIVAHHWTEAGRAEKAVPLWLGAGQMALQRATLSEAISHLTSGVNLVSKMDSSDASNDLELPLHTALGNAYVQARRPKPTQRFSGRSSYASATRSRRSWRRFSGAAG